MPFIRPNTDPELEITILQDEVYELNNQIEALEKKKGKLNRKIMRMKKDLAERSQGKLFH